MSSIEQIAARRINGLYAFDIKNFIDNKTYKYDYNIENAIHNKTEEILSKFSILDCINIITRYGDIYDAMLKYSEKNNKSINIYKNNKLIFHRKLAYYYIYNTIEVKIEFKSKGLIKFNNNKLSECSICLEPLTFNNKITTKCNHSFHIDCFHKWSHMKNSCPNCRIKLY